jgi:hypothetical protein
MENGKSEKVGGGARGRRTKRWSLHGVERIGSGQTGDREVGSGETGSGSRESGSG